MKDQLNTLGKLAAIRQMRVRQMLGRVQYQRNLCQRYRNNISGLGRLSEYVGGSETGLHRLNQQQYKTNLYKMIDLQRRELATAEEHLERLQGDLLRAMRSEKALEQFIDGKADEWNRELVRQEQKIQDALASQSWWRGTGT
ncbi:MAG TPA: flagellar export protein FliJ [Pseudomonas sp.]|uniref:flagellar export protein FliJ n=1 Tax=Pseudomonas sp. TaxID=306 RepID=UPI002B9A5106|nr:flagellar export protein FliJ [Pseudomonas sp.]HTO19661.1 flagellar export protein FliJ [Pseudomonas sp.]